MFGIGLSATFNTVTLCLWEDKEYLASLEFSSHGMHTVLFSKIQDLLQSKNKNWKDIQFIIVDTGPANSFTGLRLSLAMIKSWAMIYPVKIYQTRSTLLLYEQLNQEKPEFQKEKVSVIYFGFQGRVYLESFTLGKSISAVQDLPIEFLATYLKQQKTSLVIGNALLNIDFMEYNINTLPLYNPNIRFTSQNTIVAWEDLQPHYYRKTQAEEGLV